MANARATRSLSAYVTVACLVLMLPIVIVLILAFGDQGYLKFPPESFSLRWFATFFGDPRWQRALWSSVLIACIACVIATVLGLLARLMRSCAATCGRKSCCSRSCSCPSSFPM